MHGEQNSGEQPVRRPRSAARTSAPGNGMATVLKLLLAAVALLALAYYIGNRKSAPAGVDTAVDDAQATPTTSPAGGAEALFIDG